MISTAIAIQDATGNAVVDLSTMMLAKQIYQNKDTMSNEEFADAMFAYSAHLSSLTATLVVNAVMSEADLTNLLNTVREMDEMGKDNE
jgi:collagenase-like PrtC family protease